MNEYQHDRLVEYRRAEAAVERARDEMYNAERKLAAARAKLEEAIDRDRPSWGNLPISLQDFDRNTP